VAKGETCYLTRILLKTLFYLAEEDSRRLPLQAGEFVCKINHLQYLVVILLSVCPFQITF